MIDDLLKDARDRMGKSIESTKHEFAHRAHRTRVADTCSTA